MLFTPSPDTNGHVRTNWDNWGLIHNGTWYMYYIVGNECPGQWTAYGVASSPDGVHWSDHGDMFYPLTEVGRQNCSNPNYSLGSGWVWLQSKGTWMMNWSQFNSVCGPGQSVFFATSDTPLGPWRNVSNSLLPSRPDPQWYTSTGGMGRWDTIRVVTSSNITFGFITATLLDGPTSVQPGVGLLQTSNGYKWVAMPPPVIKFNPAPSNPNVETSGGQPLLGPDGTVRWYVLVGAAAWTSIAGRMGMFVYVSDAGITGPYIPRANYQIMAYSQGWVTSAYFAAFYPTVEHGMLVNHQSIAPGGSTMGGDYIAPLKATHVDTDGALRLTYWRGNDVLKGTDACTHNCPNPNHSCLHNEIVVEGIVLLPAGGSIRIAPCDVAYKNLTVIVSIDGATLVMNISIGGNVVETVDRSLVGLVGPQTNFTLLTRGGMFEFYLGGFLLLPARMSTVFAGIHLGATGGLRVAGVWNMTRMPPSIPVAPPPSK